MNEQYDSIKNKCPHCDRNSVALKYILEEVDNFYIVCDANPLIEGHILIIPKEHISCVGSFSSQLFNEYSEIHVKVSKFMEFNYVTYAVFEHGIIGQTVFHAHVHLLPFTGTIHDIIPNTDQTHEIATLGDIRYYYVIYKKYLFIQVNNNYFIVNNELGRPRFFRDRFAELLNVSERGNWKKVREQKEIVTSMEKDISSLQKKWNDYKKYLLDNSV